MSNNTDQRPRRRVTRKMARQRQLGALAIIAFLVLLFIILIFNGCSGGSEKEPNKKNEATTTTSVVTTTAAPVTTVATTTTNPLAAQVELSKRELFIDNIGEYDISYITQYPEGSEEINEVWKSEDESIATVDGYGHVTGVSEGETFVILSFDNNPGIEIEIKVHVASGSGDSENPAGDDTEATTDEETTTEPAVVSFTTPIA